MSNKTENRKSKDHESSQYQATVKEAVQKRITAGDHSSIIPGIDVNELKHSLDLLKYALDYSEAIVDTVGLPLIVLNKKLQVLTANRSFYETFKLTPRETENKLIYKLNEESWNIPKLKILLEKILPANTHFDNYVVEINLPQIGRRILSLNARKTYRQVNDTEAILVAFEDVTDRKELEKRKDDFIGIVSHELKTPLTSIKAFSQVLDRYLQQKNDTKGSFYLSKMLNQMEHLNQLMASFVNVYTIQNGKLKLTKKSFNLVELIKTVITDFQVTIKSHNLIYAPGKEKIQVHADRERVSQVLINLISNAVKYSPNSKKVIIYSSVEENTVTVSVRDFGIGIKEEESDKIFDRFFRVKDYNKKGPPGLGLGLYISKEIINQHKGSMWIESALEKGSTFYFSLPNR